MLNAPRNQLQLRIETSLKLRRIKLSIIIAWSECINWGTHSVVSSGRSVVSHWTTQAIGALTSIPLCNKRTYVKYLERIERTVIGFGWGAGAASASAFAEPFVNPSATRPVVGADRTRALQKAMFAPGLWLVNTKLSLSCIVYRVSCITIHTRSQKYNYTIHTRHSCHYSLAIALFSELCDQTDHQSV